MHVLLSDMQLQIDVRLTMFLQSVPGFDRASRNEGVAGFASLRPPDNLFPQYFDWVAHLPCPNFGGFKSTFVSMRQLHDCSTSVSCWL